MSIIVGKRLVKTPKIYFRDSDILHALIGIYSAADLFTHPKLGASWEGFALEEVLRAHPSEEAYFYAVHSSCELDLLMLLNRKKIGVEFTRADAPALTRSIRIVMEDLNLDELWIVYPGKRTCELEKNIVVRPLEDFLIG